MNDEANGQTSERAFLNSMFSIESESWPVRMTVTVPASRQMVQRANHLLLLQAPGSLPGHGQVQPFLRTDEVIMVVLAEVDLHPVDLPVKYTGTAGVV